MKKIMLFAAACVALAACNKNIDTTSPEKATAFEKGQKVTLTVNTGDQTKVTSNLDGSTGAVDFKWQTGDMIKVTVGSESHDFTLKSGAGESTATFEGTMPAAGESFNVQYPVTDPDLTTQTYSSTEAIPHDKMKFTATGCTLGNPFTLTPQNAALRLNLYGIERKVSQIVVTNTTSTASPKPSYALSISPAVTISNDKNTPTPFFIVVPAGASEWNFTTEVTSEPVTPSTYTLPKYPSATEPNYGSGILIANVLFGTTSAKTFKAGEILNMAALSLTTVWAPVNCGYVPKTGDSGEALGYPYGKLYQWGRKDGQGYDGNDATYPSGANLATGPISDISTVSAEKFYKVTTNPYNWYSGSSPAANDLWKEDGSSTYDPCPEGWRVPTAAELTALMGSHTGGALQDGDHGTLTNIKGKYFDGSTAATPTSGVFLPAAGYRGYFDGSAGGRGDGGYYWSSSVYGFYAWFLCLYDNEAFVYSDGRANGCSVRCVQE